MSLLMNWLESLSYEIKAGDRCLRKFSPFSTCTVCSDSCDVQVFSYENGIPIIDTQNCDHCGRCITVCPVQAIEGQSPSRNIVNKILILEDTPLPTINELLRFHVHDIQTISINNHNERLENTVEETNALLILMNKSPFKIIRSEECITVQPTKLSRRNFFNKLSWEGKKLAATTITPVKWRFNHGKFKMTDLYPYWAFFSIELNQEQCTLCSACFRLCPEKVFSINEGLLNITTGNCTGCSLCVDVCQDKGISIKQDVCQSNIKSWPIKEGICKTCGDSFLSWHEDETCYICKSRKANNYL